jgi:hypothetical protein
MPARCTICTSPLRSTFDAAVSAGRRVKDVARDLSLPYESAKRHARGHIGSAPAARKSTRRMAESASLSPVETFRAAFGFDPMPHQVAYLDDGRDTLVLKGRQVGMTAAASALAIFTARSGPGRDAVIISPSQRQSGEVTVRARLGLRELGEKLPQDSAGLLRLENGSRIISLPGNSRGVRGYAPALVIIDEAAWVADETWTAARPLVSASGGRIAVQSTPGAPVGFFYELATSTPEGWARIHVSSEEVPTIPKDFLARERASMSDALYRSEYLGEFVSPDSVAEIGKWFTPESFDERVSGRWAPLVVPALAGGDQ